MCCVIVVSRHVVLSLLMIREKCSLIEDILSRLFQTEVSFGKTLMRNETALSPVSGGTITSELSESTGTSSIRIHLGLLYNDVIEVIFS